MINEAEHSEFGKCIRLSNRDADLLVSLDFGPRILHYALDGGENILGWHPDAAVETEIGTWRPYGGHRLWLAPENMPLSYAPDNNAVDVDRENDLSILFTCPADAAGIEKQIRVKLAENGSGVSIEHRITNRRTEPIEAAAWALTIMRPGGETIVPNEPFKPYGPDTLLPIRTLTLWPYTDLTDPRWTFDKESVRLRVDENLGDPQKFGVLNRQGWAAYRWKGILFTKRFIPVDSAAYPDMNSNTEVYTAGGFVEVETLSPLKRLGPGSSIDHEETWELRQD